jgi:hypothetical protein
VILRILCACVTRFLFSKVLPMNIVFSFRSQSTTIEVFLDSSGLKFSLRGTCGSSSRSIIYNLSFLAYRFRPGIFSISLRYLYIRL